MHKAYRQLGLSLVELMITVAVIAILAGISLPALGSMSAGNNLNTVQENIIETLKKARGLAVSHSTFATVTINSAAHTVQLSLSDGSQPPETIHVHSNINFGADATLEFSAQGTVTAQAGTTTINLSSTGYANLPPRSIGISPTGIVTATR